MRKSSPRPPVHSGPAPATAKPDPGTLTFGTPDTVTWITSRTTRDRTITSAIPPVFERFATFEEVNSQDDALFVEQERAVVDHLAEFGPHEWWLGYLDTGAHDVVFPTAKKVKMYASWPYVIVKAGPDEALTWRDSPPDLIFPVDRSWLMSMLWDDGWTSIGGPARLIEKLAANPLVRARTVELGTDATPPGQLSY